MNKKSYLDQANDVMGDIREPNEKKNQKNVWLNEANTLMEVEDIYGGEEDEDIVNEPNKEEDCFLTPSGPLGSKISVSCGGKHIGEFSEETDALKAVADWQDENKFYPTIWWVSDHGNFWPIDREGNEIK